MAYHGVLIPTAIAATNIDSYNRSAVEAEALDNGNVVVMGVKSTTAGLSEVFEVSQPVTGALTGLWMVYSGDEIVVTDARYKGIDPDVRNFYNAANKVFSVYKPQLGDIITLTDAAIYGTYDSSTHYYLNATDQSWELAWGASNAGSCLCYKLLSVGYVSLGTGAMDNQRVVAYTCECVAV